MKDNYNRKSSEEGEIRKSRNGFIDSRDSVRREQSEREGTEKNEREGTENSEKGKSANYTKDN